MSNDSYKKKTVNIDVILVQVIAALLPLLVYGTEYGSRLYGYIFAAQNPVAYDRFLIIKVWVLGAAAVIMAVRMLKTVKKSANRSGKVILLVVFLAAWFLVSTVFSVDIRMSLLGADEQFEPLPVLICYIIVGAYGGWVRIHADNEVLFDVTRLTVSVLLTVLFVIGAVQRIGGGNEAYMTLYNSNYAGMFIAMLLPLTYCGVPAGRRLVCTAGLLTGSAALLLTGAKTAIITAAAVFLYFCIVQYVPGRLARRAVLIGAVLLCGALLLFVYRGDAGRGHAASYENHVSNVETFREGICFTREGEKLWFGFDMPDSEHYNFSLKDGQGREVAYEKNSEETRFVPVDDRFGDYEFTIADYGDYYGFIVYVDGREWYLAKGNDGDYYYVNGYTGLDKFVMAESIGFRGIESIATNRGYIWSRSLPLLFNRPLTGSGPDTFAAVFPQNDVAKYLTTDLPYKMIITKPHNMYLQLGCQCGIIALIIFAVIMCLKIRNRKRDNNSGAVLLCVVSFLFMGLFYDSSVCVTPVFSLLAGLL